jgi:hypothetical protein
VTDKLRPHAPSGLCETLIQTCPSGPAPTDLTGAQNFPANGGMTVATKETDSPILFSGKGEKLSIVSTGSGATDWLNYYISP